MKKQDIKVGGRYVVKISSKLVVVEVATHSIHYGGWNVINQSTGRAVYIKTAARFRRPADTHSLWLRAREIADKLHIQLGVKESEAGCSITLVETSEQRGYRVIVTRNSDSVSESVFAKETGEVE